MTIALQNTVILTPVTLIVRVSDRRELIPQGAPSCRNAIDQNGRFCPNHPALPSGLRPSLLFPHFAKDRFISGDSSQANTIGDTPLNRSLRIRLVRQSATMQLVSIHLTMSG